MAEIRSKTSEIPSHAGARSRAGGSRRNAGGARPGAARGARWVMFQTFPQAERLAAQELTREGYRTYLPLIADRQQDAVIKSMWHLILVCRFPGIGFVELGSTDPWLPIRETSGVSGLSLSETGRPSPIPVGEIERHMADDEELCDLTRDVHQELPARARVTIEGSALTGCQGIVVACNGLVTTADVEVFGRRRLTRVARSMVVVG